MAHADERAFAAGSLIIPTDLSYQDSGLLQSYGLLFALLSHNVPVSWVIDPAKTFHAGACNTPGDACAWDCEIEGSGIKCPYPTASPDFFAATTVVWDDAGLAAPGTVIANHGYRGGPFVIDAAHATAARAIIDAWNDPAQWAANPWAQRTVVHVVSVHEVTAAFTGTVAKDMLAAPTIAVFSDGNEAIATGYLRAAGIPQSNGSEFPTNRCGGGATCGPGTANPDMLDVASVAGDMGTCDAASNDHHNGALFTGEGLPAYCQIMSMHWDVRDRETVLCNGGACPATPAQCAGEPITYHGHEVVAEVREFLQYPVHFFAECQAVNAYENTTQNPAWPFLDDAGRDGHFLTTPGVPIPCPCDAGYACVTGGCAGADCCISTDILQAGGGFVTAPQPNSSTLQTLRPDVPYNQLDGEYGTVGGSEPSYNLNPDLGVTYKNDRQVTLLTGPNGPGEQDLWMSGYLDGNCDVIERRDGHRSAGCAGGKVSYLGGHKYGTAVPISDNTDSQGARLFLNALFEADCVTAEGQPSIDLTLTGGILLDGQLVLGVRSLPAEGQLQAGYANNGAGAALDVALHETVPDGVQIVSATDGGVVTAGAVEWNIGGVSGAPGRPGDPSPSGVRGTTFGFAAEGTFTFGLSMTYRVGASTITAPSQSITLRVALDSDGDGLPDDDDASPSDPLACGDSDGDTCDDCSGGHFDPASDGADTDGDGVCDAGESGSGVDGGGGGCCQASGGPDVAPLGFLGLALLVGRRRRRAQR